MIFTKATLEDIPFMQDIVKQEVLSGLILHRSDDEVATNIRSYTLAKLDDTILGYAALHIHTKELSEVRSLVVAKKYRGKKIGANLVNELLNEARDLRLKRVLTLTYEQKFFENLNFKEVPKESLPEQKIWADCIKCKHFPICNEVSLIINL